MGVKEAGQLLCPHLENTNSSKKYQSVPVSVILYIVFITEILLATFGNMVVIICIAHFKQLHTPTNVLTLSMAVADFIIGIFVMPVYLIKAVSTCCYCGGDVCMAAVFCYTAITTVSTTHLIFLSLDRYYAVCYPLLYSTKITIGTAWVFVAVSWISSISYSAIMDYILITFLFSKQNFCVGFCAFLIYISLFTIDMLCSFILPFSFILVLYSKIFIIAVQHVKSLRRITDKTNTVHRNKKGFTDRRNKATVTIGIVIGTFFSFVSQFYILKFTEEFTSVSLLIKDTSEYLVLSNFALNPLIYGLFYPWFRKGFKFIITCKIFKPDSSLTNLFLENY